MAVLDQSADASDQARRRLVGLGQALEAGQGFDVTEILIHRRFDGVEGLSVDVFNEGQIVLFIAVDVAVKRGKGTGMLGIRTEETVFDDGVAFFQRLLIRCAGKFRSVLDDGLDPVVDNAFKKVNNDNNAAR